MDQVLQEVQLFDSTLTATHTRLRLSDFDQPAVCCTAPVQAHDPEAKPDHPAVVLVSESSCWPPSFTLPFFPVQPA